MPLAVGHRIGAYELIGPLGAGGMGEVYRARDTRLGREVAIKSLPAVVAGDPDQLARFESEARTLAALNHPNIAAIYGLEEAEGQPVLVLELVEGESLAERLQRGALLPADTIAIGLQIAAAVEAAHERDIVHRDLKPGNIMLTPAGAVKVLDFGLAKRSAEGAAGDAADAAALSDSPTRMPSGGRTLPGTILGTAAYMSPEQARGLSVDRRSDVWSFGCVLFECLTGHAPFQGETATDLIAKVLERDPPWGDLPGATPVRLRQVLRKCLQKDAEQRPRDIRDVRLELTELASKGGKGETTGDRSIAVLPFDNLSGPDDEYFADGVTEEILNALAQIEGLHVAARTSCFAFKGRRDDLREIGEKLDVTAVLEGSIRRAGTRLRITVQLVHVADGYQIWSEKYDRELTDVFEVQDEIASAIVSKLKVTLHGPGEAVRGRRGTSNLEAYELYLRGRKLILLRGRYIFDAIECLEKAFELDPQYADALALASDGYRLLATFGIAEPGVVMERARGLVQRALAIEPEMAEALATQADVECQYDRDYARAKETWARAIASDPRNVRARCEHVLWRSILGHIPYEYASSELTRAATDEPLNTWVAAMASFVHGMAGRHELSLAEAQRGVELERESFFAQWNVMRCHAWTGQYEEVFAMGPRLLAASGRHPWVLNTLAYAHAQSGRREMARAIHDELEARSQTEFVAPSMLAGTACSAGLLDEAVRYALLAAEKRDPFILTSRRVPEWAPLRADPRLAEMAKEVWRAE